MKFVSENQSSAHTLVARAIKKKKLIPLKTCENCGNTPGYGKDGRRLIQAHHHNGYTYEHYLDVIWLCISCHRKVHSNGLQRTPWKARWDNVTKCPSGHDDNFGINNRGHRFCRTCANAKRRKKVS